LIGIVPKLPWRTEKISCASSSAPILTGLAPGCEFRKII